MGNQFLQRGRTKISGAVNNEKTEKRPQRKGAACLNPTFWLTDKDMRLFGPGVKDMPIQYTRNAANSDIIQSTSHQIRYFISNPDLSVKTIIFYYIFSRETIHAVSLLLHYFFRRDF